MRNGTIRGTHLWKRFRSDRRRSLLRDEIERAYTRLRHGESTGWRWALRDVDLEAQPGDAIGLIGANGSGKSTLLKILTRVMYPYAGHVEIAGRVGALIEVRAGIHPDLTGRENVYLYGSLLGLKRKEVTKKFDDIVSFAQVEEAIDRQVKFYSSGMQMRLGFSVAAFLEPDILLVDEVLAVGDASFQQRCLDRMRDVLNQGTTLVFVSHDLAAVEATCTKGVWLQDGVALSTGDIGSVLTDYRRAIEQSAESIPQVGGLVTILKAEASPVDGTQVQTLGDVELNLVLQSAETRQGVLFIGVSEGPSTPIFSVSRDVQLQMGNTEVRCCLSRIPLPQGRYYLWMGMKGVTRTQLVPWHPVTSFDVVGPRLARSPRGVVRLAPVYVQADWEVGRQG